MAASRNGGSDPSEPSPDDRVRDDRIRLVDKSAWEQRIHHPRAVARLDELVSSGRAATCLPTALEMLYSAQNRRDFDERRELVDELVWLPVTAAVEAAALEIMAKLAGRGQHRMPPTDLTIAATALVHGAVVLHYDRDFERIAEVTDLRQEWIVPRGHGHGRTPE